MPGRQTGSARAYGLALAGLCLAAAGCQQPRVGARTTGTAASAGPTIVLEDGWLDLHGHAVATFTVTQDDLPLPLDDVTALEPRFTLATLGDHPVDQFREWKSELLTGAQVAAKLPTAGPGSDPEILTSARQPGCETPASFVDLGGGRYRYVFASALTGFDPDTTVRIGVWLEGASTPSLATSSTFDFRPGGAPAEVRDTVLDENCSRCHGTLVYHETRSRVRLCLTCHTWQNSDPDTIDPAALQTTTTTVADPNNPNPLELGRLLHRIHRGKDLPTVYKSKWDGSSQTLVNSNTALPLPFYPTRSGVLARNDPLVGRKYSIIGEMGTEFVFAQALNVYTSDPSIATMSIVAGGMFPRDLRDCDVCHGLAPQTSAVTYSISRRICSGCHPEIWFQSSSPASDPVRFPHPGGPQLNDSQCRGCHIDATGTSAPKVYAPIAEIHVPPARAPRYNKPAIEIIKVANLVPGGQPQVTFRLRDRGGTGPTIVPSPSAPNPAWEDPSFATSSYVPRKLTALSIRITGPTTPDYSSFPNVDLQSWLSSNKTGNPDALALSTTTDEYVYTFTSTIPAGATGTWVLGMEAKRNSVVPVNFYDVNKNEFLWPYTGETVNETAENPIIYVNTASGIWPPPAGSPDPVPRRTVVDQQKCLRCHDRIEFHGSQRHEVAWCVTCHTWDNTDWDKARPRRSDGTVNLGATYDGIEERSTHFKMMIHRIHTGARRGAASLEAIAPFVIYYSKAYFFDRGGFPNDLRNCTVCHAGKTYLVEAIPADAPATVANEQPTIWHTTGSAAPVPGEPSLPRIQAACTGCHATGATFEHVESKTIDGVETCAQCHSKGTVSVEVAHGLAPPAGGVAATFSSIAQGILVPRCATAACHSGSPPVAFPQLDADAAYAALVGVPSQQSSLKLVEPGAPEQSYLVYKLRGDAGAVGGSPSTTMPIGDSALDEADIRAIEAWIANGAPND